MFNSHLLASSSSRTFSIAVDAMLTSTIARHVPLLLLLLHSFISPFVALVPFARFRLRSGPDPFAKTKQKAINATKK